MDKFIRLAKGECDDDDFKRLHNKLFKMKNIKKFIDQCELYEERLHHYKLMKKLEKEK